MRIFQELGSAIRDAWQKVDYDERAFPSLVAGTLRREQVHRRLAVGDVLRWLLSEPELPEQDDLQAAFGSPPITVYHGRRFYIQVLCWLHGSTTIHRHGFSGAFMVLDGSSIHCRYDFELRRRVNARLMLGDIRFAGAEMLERGDVVEITNDLIHSLFHLEVPSATLVARTYRDGDASPQFDYSPPSLAMDPFFQDPSMVRRLQGLTFLRRVSPQDHDQLAADLIGRSDLHTGWLVLHEAYHATDDPGRLGPLLEAARQRHGEVVSELTAVLFEELRQEKISRLRAAVKDPEHRFFLALLQNLPHRDAIYAFCRRRYPEDDPRARICAWAEALTGVDAIGVDFDDALNRHLFRALLDGCSEDAIRSRLKGEFDPDAVDAQAPALARHCDRIRRTALAPLFSEGFPIEPRAPVGPARAGVATADREVSLPQTPADPRDAPAFIACCARSGSTLLRYVLDTHPDLCCPPELHLASQLFHGSHLVLYTLMQSFTPPRERPLDLDAMYAEVRRIATGMVGPYVARSGKRRWCDKSTTTVDHLDLVHRVFPEAKVILLHRNCMDVVRSALDASEYGWDWPEFQGYLLKSPTNLVDALIDYWVEKTEKLLEFETKHPARCWRVTYEALVFSPEETARGVLSFLGLAWHEGLVDSVFSVPHPDGPGDYKIQSTNRIEQSSVGRGSSIPFRQISKERREAMNVLLERLGYPTVGPDWNQRPSPYRPPR